MLAKIIEPQKGFNYAVQLNLKREYRISLPHADEPGFGSAPKQKIPSQRLGIPLLKIS